MTQLVREVPPSIAGRFDLRDITPRYYETRRYDLVNAAGKSPVLAICLYVSRPVVLRLKPLYDAITSYLINKEVDPLSVVEVGQRHYRPLLAITKRKMRAFSPKNKPLWISCDCVTYRSREGFTLVSFSRSATIYARNDCRVRAAIERSPSVFFRNLLSEVEYPRYVYEHTVACGKQKQFLSYLETIRYNNARGWRIDL